MKNIYFFTLFLILSQAAFSQNCCGSFSQNASNNGDSTATFGVALGDLDGDGDLDAVTIAAYDFIEVWFNDGNGIFSSGAIYSDGDFFDVKLVDVNNDGDLDIIAGAFYSSQKTEVWTNDGNGNFALDQEISTNLYLDGIGVADLDGDGDVDLFCPGNSNGDQKVYYNNGWGYFALQFSFSGNAGGKNDVALADFDGDGDIDAILSDDSGNSNEYWRNDSTNGFTFVAAYGQQDSYKSVAAGDFDGDGDQDFVLVGMDIPSEVYLNDGNGNFTFSSYLAGTNYDKSVEVIDYNNDGFDDIIIGAYGGASPEVWTNDGNAQFTSCWSGGGSAHDLAVGDVNGDGYADIYLGNFSSSAGDKVFIQTPGGTTTINPAGPYCSKSLQDTLTAVDPGGIWSGPGITDTINGIFDPGIAGVGIHQITYTLNDSCGTTGTIDIQVLSLDNSVTLNGQTLTSNDTNSSTTYQWIDCGTNTPITNATNQSFTPTITGDYAVVVDNGACSDTSDCFNVIITNSQNIYSDNIIKIYPNPAKTYIYIENVLKSNIEIVDLVGKTIINVAGTNKTKIDISYLQNGIYFIKIDNKIYKLIKN